LEKKNGRNTKERKGKSNLGKVSPTEAKKEATTRGRNQSFNAIGEEPGVKKACRESQKEGGGR